MLFAAAEERRDPLPRLVLRLAGKSTLQRVSRRLHLRNLSLRKVQHRVEDRQEVFVLLRCWRQLAQKLNHYVPNVFEVLLNLCGLRDASRAPAAPGVVPAIRAPGVPAFRLRAAELFDLGGQVCILLIQIGDLLLHLNLLVEQVLNQRQMRLLTLIWLASSPLSAFSSSFSLKPSSW